MLQFSSELLMMSLVNWNFLSQKLSIIPHKRSNIDIFHDIVLKLEYHDNSATNHVSSADTDYK